MIKKLKIQNFRSIKEVEIDLGKLNAFIGPNNAGKSNILKAMDLVLGVTYPSINSFDEEDFYNYDKSQSINIEVYFENNLECDNSVWGFKLTFDKNNCDYVAIDQSGKEVVYQSSGKTKKVSNEMREEVFLMYIPLERQASNQLRPTGWTLYGKLLKHINNLIDHSEKESFKNQVQDAYQMHLKPNFEKLEEILKSYTQQQIGLEIKLNLSILDPIDTIKNLRPYFIKEDKEFDAEDIGAGTQSALAIAIAKAYAEFVKKPFVLAIEEPELFLHPHGCRLFYKLLQELTVQKMQIIYTTHERSFIDIANYDGIHLVRNEGGRTKVYSGNSLPFPDGFDEVKLTSKFNEYVNEIFFAEHVILVEGFSDKIACELALEKLSVNLDLKNISIIDCGSKTAIKPYAEILKHFGIKTFTIFDEDAKNEIERLKNLIGESYIFVQSPDLEDMLGRDKLGLKQNAKLNREDALRKLPRYFETYEVPDLYKQLKGKIEGGKT